MKYRTKRQKRSEDFWLWAYADLITNLLIFFVALLSVADLNQVKLQEVAEKLSGKRDQDSLSAIESRLNKDIHELGYDGVVRTDLTRDGLEISFDSGVMFDSGQAAIKPQYTSVMKSVMTSVLPYTAKYRFAVEGHTDDRPVAQGSRFASNWELSSARALQIRRQLEVVGVPQTKLRVESYAANKPIPEAKLVGLSLNEIQARQRRVVIRIF